jgi:hypothetical protein
MRGADGISYTTRRGSNTDGLANSRGQNIAANAVTKTSMFPRFLAAQIAFRDEKVRGIPVAPQGAFPGK